MKKTDIFKASIILGLCLITISANSQNYKVKQVLVANGGAYSFLGNYITIGSFDPSTKKYTLFDSVTGGSVTQVLIDSGYAYMATDSYLVKYNLANLKRIAITKCHELRYLAAYKDKIVATIGYDQTTTHLKIFKKSNLSLVYSENKAPDIYANGITVVGDSAYIALQGQYPGYNDTGRIAVEDLAHQKFKRVITLDTTTRGISDMFVNGNTIVGVTEYPYSNITEINPAAGTKKIIQVSDIYLPFDLIDDSLYAGFNNGVGGYDLNSNSTKLSIKPDPFYAAAALDTVNRLFYYTGSSFTKPTKTWIYDYNNKAIDSFKVGISPEAVAIEYVDKSGINEPGINADNLVLYPNPAGTSLFLTGINAKNAGISIIDITGRILFNENENMVEGQMTQIPVSGLGNGMYFITIQSSDGTISKRFVKN